LRLWADEAWERGRRAELEALAKSLPESRNDLERSTANIPLNTPLARNPLVEEALHSYARTARLAQDAIKEYYRHFEVSRNRITMYLPAIDDLNAEAELVTGDKEYLQAMLDPANRQALASSAAEHYRRAIAWNQLVLLQYYITDEVAQRFFPPGMTRGDIKDKFINDKALSAEELNRIFTAAMGAFPPGLKDVENADYIRTYLDYIARAQIRLENLK
jgi:hypothetical protein